jgi:hypothetical protein
MAPLLLTITSKTDLPARSSAMRAVHHLGRRSAPIFHGQSGPLPEHINNRLDGVRFQGTVGNNRTGFFLAASSSFVSCAIAVNETKKLTNSAMIRP